MQIEVEDKVKSSEKTFNLFVYGTLMNPSVFRAVLGKRLVPLAGDADNVESFIGRPASLEGYKKISPDKTYMYAIPDSHSCIPGYVIGPLPGECMESLLKYEGRNYSRHTFPMLAVSAGPVSRPIGRRKKRKGPAKRQACIICALGPRGSGKTAPVQRASKDAAQAPAPAKVKLSAVAFVGNLKRMEHSFGYPFNDPLKQEILLREKIEGALLQAEREQLHTDEGVARRALGELHGSTIRDIIRRHFESGGISDYAIRRSLSASSLRDYSRVAMDQQAIALAPNYLSMVIRQVIFNQIEDKIRQDFRYELDRMNERGNYYERAMSSLVALRVLNESSWLLDMLCADCFGQVAGSGRHLVDYVRWAVGAADWVYDSAVAGLALQFIRENMDGGSIPMGAELEFSNTGHAVISDPLGTVSKDTKYDGFLYFTDFALDALTWKLGGHIDDHHQKTSDQPRRGFFETALGSISLQPNLSKPITANPWALNQLIQEVIRFYHIAPHSLHISFQLRNQHRPGQNRLLPLYAMKCLFILAGDPVRSEGGKVVMRRLTSDEIMRINPEPNMLFCEISKRHSSDTGESLASFGPGNGRFVQQFKFIRLSPKLDYEVIALGLKGLQLSLRPDGFLSPAQYKNSAKHRDLFHGLVDWAGRPDAVSEPEMMAFLGHIYDGLSTEYQGRASHSADKIAAALGQMKQTILNFNDLVAGRREVM
jgi:hypothetical protein